MKVPFKTLEAIKNAGYRLTYYAGHKTKCFIKKDNGIFADGREIPFNSPTRALKYIKSQTNYTKQ